MKQGSKTRFINEDLEDKCEYFDECQIELDDLFCYGEWELCPYYQGLKMGEKIKDESLKKLQRIRSQRFYE